MDAPLARPPTQSSRPSTHHTRPNTQLSSRPASQAVTRPGTQREDSDSIDPVAQFPVHWQVDEVVHFTYLMSKVLDKLIVSIRKQYLRIFSVWKVWTLAERARVGKIKERLQVIDVLKKSTRGRRTMFEIDILKRFIVHNLKCIPSQSLNSSEMEKLCNEVDFSPSVGKSIIFLQGDFGNCYYMIAHGTIGLYFEDSKDKEMVMGRELGRLKGQPLPENFDVASLGKRIVNLPAGAGFGEFAILNTTQKIRSASAVAIDDESLLLILHADTYDACLRKFHYRQRALSAAIKLLQELPLFNFAGFTKVSQLAYAMRNSMMPTNSVVAAANQVIQHVYLISTGTVKVFAPKLKTKDADRVLRAVEGRVPRMCVCTLGRGKVVGFSEVRRGLDRFELHYVSASPDCELFEIPLSVYVNHIKSPALQQSSYYKDLVQTSSGQECSYSDRIARVNGLMRQMLTNTVGQKADAREELMAMLPSIIEDNGFICRTSIGDGSLSFESRPRPFMSLAGKMNLGQHSSLAEYSNIASETKQSRLLRPSAPNSIVSVKSQRTVGSVSGSSIVRRAFSLRGGKGDGSVTSTKESLLAVLNISS